jgi:hypothetical protein
MEKDTDPGVVERTARDVYRSFRRYDHNYRRITVRAAERFARRDWAGANADRGERVELWEKSIARTVALGWWQAMQVRQAPGGTSAGGRLRGEGARIAAHGTGGG